jgi:hypothetical protein
MNNKITIIEGPTPVFERLSGDPERSEELSWAVGILEGPFLYDTFLTTLRTFDSSKLLDRCKTTWESRQTMFLEYKDEVGLRKEDPIIAARALTVEEGDMLLLWVRRELDSEHASDFVDFTDLED